MSGYCAIGITINDSSPAIVVTIAMTVASRGLSIKMAENMVSSPSERGRRRVCHHSHTGTQAFHPLHDHLLPAFQSIVDDRVRAGLAAKLHASDRRLAVDNEEDVDSLLIGNQRRLWY